MIPDTNLTTDLVVSEDAEVTMTYKLSNDKIQGYSDKIEALQQSIYKMLDTKKYEYPIYSFDYGIELESLIGKDQIYVKSELKRRITDCLLLDDRIQSVGNFVFVSSGDSLLCTFDVVSIYGELSINKEVAV
jgi:hypothetical protein